MKVPFVDLLRQHRALAKSFQKQLAYTIANNHFILGKPVEAFEQAFARHVGVGFAVGVASGTEALHLSLRAAGVGEGDEVLIPSMTFAATALAVLYAGATPVTVDVQSENALIDLQDAGKAISPRTKAIIPVHLYGQSCDMDQIMAFATKHHLKVIEDACQSHGSLWGKKATGTYGIAGCYSFYPSKNLGALGDGGMIVTNDAALHQKLLMLRNYGQPQKYRHETLGFNSRLDGLQASFLSLKLRHLKRWNRLRQKHAARYRQKLKGLPIQLFAQEKQLDGHIYHLLVIRAQQREKLQTYLSSQGIETNIHYPIPIHAQGFMKEANAPQRPCPVADGLSKEILSLPMFPELTPKEIDYVCQALHAYFK